MSFNDHLAALDAAAFTHLSDDRAALLTRGPEVVATVAVILDRVERTSSRAGIATLETADVARISKAELAAIAPGLEPQAGDQLRVNGKTWSVHGMPWLDEAMDARDWLCPISD